MIGEYFEDTFTLSRGIRLTRRVQGGKKRFLLLELRQNTRTAATAATITVHNYRLRVKHFRRQYSTEEGTLTKKKKKKKWLERV